MNPERENNFERPKARSLAKSLGALFAMGSGLVLGSASNTNATTSGPAQEPGVSHFEARVQRIQDQLAQSPGTEVGSGTQSSDQVQTALKKNEFVKLSK